MAKVNNSSSYDITPYLLSGGINSVELLSNADIELIARNTQNNASLPFKLSIQVKGSVCNIEGYSGVNCRFANQAGTGVTSDGKNAWYQAICEYQSKFYKCNGGNQWAPVAGF